MVLQATMTHVGRYAYMGNMPGARPGFGVFGAFGSGFAS